MLEILSNTNSIANQFIAELRDVACQKDRMRFRRNLERLGEIMAYEVSKTLDYQQQDITTPLGISKTSLISNHPVVMTIMRAGLPFYNGFLNFFDRADSGFVGVYRVEGQEDIEIAGDYIASGNITGKTLILVDPMLATGKSLVSTLKKIMKFGEPKYIHLVSAIAAPEGINYIDENFDRPHTIWAGSVDEKLNENAYIVPGLGDAGDLCFGPKL